MDAHGSDHTLATKLSLSFVKTQSPCASAVRLSTCDTMARFWLSESPILESWFPQWWERTEESEQVQFYANEGLGIAYSTIAAVAMIQLIRIQLRVPEYGWTTQKVFHLLNALVAALRSGVFLFRPALDSLHPAVVRLVLFDLPGLLFFTTYTLLVLFWAEIYHQARSLPTGSLRPIFVVFNTLVYTVQGCLWAFDSFCPPGSITTIFTIVSRSFLAVVSVIAACGFLLYGGRLFLMLKRFPIESRGRKKKLREVGLVTTICATCFTLRAIMVAMSAINASEFNLDVMEHPLLNVIYYSLAEIIPAAWVLYILRKLPPRRNTQGYQQIPTQ